MDFPLYNVVVPLIRVASLLPDIDDLEAIRNGFAEEAVIELDLLPGSFVITNVERLESNEGDEEVEYKVSILADFRSWSAFTADFC